MASSFLRFPYHTQRRITLGRTPLDEWSARRRDLYLTTHVTLTTERHPCPGWDSNPNLSRRVAADLRLRPRGQWDRYYNILYISQGEHKVFPWLQTFITRKLLYVEYKQFFFRNVTHKVFFTTHRYTSTCAPFVPRRTSNRQSISLHVFSNTSTVTVAKASAILAFKFVISGIGVENTLSLTYRHKKMTRAMITGDRGGQGVGPSLPIHQFGNVAFK